MPTWAHLEKCPAQLRDQYPRPLPAAAGCGTSDFTVFYAGPLQPIPSISVCWNQYFAVTT